MLRSRLIDLPFQPFSDSIDNGLMINFVGAPGASKPTFSGKGQCGTLQGQTPPPELSAAPPSGWAYKRTVQGAADGIYEFVVGNASTFPAGAGTGANARLMVRKGALDNPMVWTVQADYSKDLLSGSAGSWKLTHKAAGAE